MKQGGVSSGAYGGLGSCFWGGDYGCGSVEDLALCRGFIAIAMLAPCRCAYADAFAQKSCSVCGLGWDYPKSYAIS